MKIFDFLVSGLWKIDFLMKIFVCLVSGLLKINFSMTVFVFFGVRSIEKCFFNESVCFFGFRHCGRRCCACFFICIYHVFRTWIGFSMRVFVFFGLRPIENWFFDEGVCFLASGIVEDGAVRVFSFEFCMFLGPELFFQWKSLFFFGFRPIENRFLNESLCFFGFNTIENWFFNESVCFFGLRPIENWFFNESVCFFGFSFKIRIFLSLRVFVFLGLRPIDKLIFPWECLFFWLQALWKTAPCPFSYMTV